MVKISVIIPVYNVEEFIIECINSLLVQTLKEIEIIVIDDGSIDNSINLVKKICDNRIKLIHQSNLGLSEARNTGINVAKGEYILFLDSDDFIINQNSLTEMYELATKYQSDILVGNAIEYYSDNNEKPLYRDKNEFFERVMNNRDFLIRFIRTNSLRIAACFNLYKRDFIEENNLIFKSGLLHEDELFTPSALLKSNRVAIYPKEFYAYRQRQGSIMNSKRNIKRAIDLLTIFEELIDIYSQINDNELRITLDNRNYNLIITTLLDYDIKDISLKLKIYLLKNSVSFRALVINSICIINLVLYKKVLKNVSN